MLTTAIETVRGRDAAGVNGNDGWPGIVSRFQLVILAARRSKQLYQGAQPRILADPLKRRNTNIALEELRRGLVPFKGRNKNESQNGHHAIDTDGNMSVVEHAPEFDLAKAD